MNVAMSIVNWPAMVKGINDAHKLQVRYMRGQMSREAKAIRKKFINEQLRGRPGIAAQGKLSKGNNVWTHVEGDSPKTIAGHIGISRILNVHEQGITIHAKNSKGLMYLRGAKTGKGKGPIIAVSPIVRIPARLKFRALVATEAPKALAKVHAAGVRAVDQAISTQLKKSVQGLKI